MKQTAVQWYMYELANGKIPAEEAYKQALEMEKEQIVDAVYHTCNAMSHSDLPCGEQYYNKNFKSE
jgi:hypothetical protein